VVVWPVSVSRPLSGESDALNHMWVIAQTLDSLHVGLCLFGAEDRTLTLEPQLSAAFSEI